MSTRLAIVQRNQDDENRTLNEEQLPIPTLEKSQVLVKVEVAALNPTDGTYHQQVKLPSICLPRSLMSLQSSPLMVMPSETALFLDVTLQEL
jgi:NADPH:quinone reductase-like Zn-dependent oxidoreductase